MPISRTINLAADEWAQTERICNKWCCVLQKLAWYSSEVGVPSSHKCVFQEVPKICNNWHRTLIYIKTRYVFLTGPATRILNLQSWLWPSQCLVVSISSIAFIALDQPADPVMKGNRLWKGFLPIPIPLHTPKTQKRKIPLWDLEDIESWPNAESTTSCPDSIFVPMREAWGGLRVPSFRISNIPKCHLTPWFKMHTSMISMVRKNKLDHDFTAGSSWQPGCISTWCKSAAESSSNYFVAVSKHDIHIICSQTPYISYTTLFTLCNII